MIMITQMEVNSIADNVKALVVEISSRSIERATAINEFELITQVTKTNLGLGVENRAKRGQVHVSKNLYSKYCKELKDIDSSFEAIKNVVKRYASDVPFREGRFLLAVDEYRATDGSVEKGRLIKRMLQEIEPLQDTFQISVERFIDKFPEILNDNRIDNGNLFDLNDYAKYIDPQTLTINREAIRRKFRVDIRIYPYSNDSILLGEISKDLAVNQNEVATNERTLQALASRENIATRLANELTKILDIMKTSSKRFRQETLDSLKEFLDFFPVKNLSGDKALESLVLKLQDVLKFENSASLTEQKKLLNAAIMTGRESTDFVDEIDQVRLFSLDMVAQTKDEIEALESGDLEEKNTRVFSFAG